MSKKEQPRRRSLNDRLDAELASAESIPVAGFTAASEPHPAAPQEGKEEKNNPQSTDTAQPLPSITGGDGGGSNEGGSLLTKKATTIMPKEVFAALQRYCTDTDTPKHRALYFFLLDGLRAAAAITDTDYQRFRDMAAQLTTTYEKKPKN